MKLSEREENEIKETIEKEIRATVEREIGEIREIKEKESKEREAKEAQKEEGQKEKRTGLRLLSHLSTFTTSLFLVSL